MTDKLTRRVLGEVAQLAATQMPLAEGLRVAADEAGSCRTSAALRRIASRIERGQSLETVLGDSQLRVPGHVSRLLQGADSPSDACAILVELSQHQRDMQSLRRGVLSALLYPAMLIGLTAIIVIFVLQVVVPEMRQLYTMVKEVDVEVNRHFLTGAAALFWFSEKGLQMGLWFLLVVACLAALCRLLLGAGDWWWLLSSIPLFGRMLSWSGAWEFSRLMQMLLRRSTPLAAALRLTAAGLWDANLADMAGRLARSVEEGAPLGRSMLHSARIPASLSSLVDWGEQRGALPEALDLAAEIFEGRLRIRTAWLQTFLPPVIYVLVASIAVGLVVSLMSPLITLIQALS